MDSVLHFAIFSAAYNLRNENKNVAEELRTFIQEGLRKYLNTLTRISYSPSGKDLVTHNVATLDAYSRKASVAGASELMSELKNKNALEALLGTKDVKKINGVFQWINGTNGHIWRLNSKPQGTDEKVVGFGAGSGGLDLYCDGDPLYGYSAFRVLRVD